MGEARKRREPSPAPRLLLTFMSNFMGSRTAEPGEGEGAETGSVDNCEDRGSREIFLLFLS